MANDKTLFLLGGGGHAAVVADAASSAGWRVVGFFDDNPAASVPDLDHLGKISSARQACAEATPPVSVHAAVGDGDLRAAWLEMLVDFDQPAIVHPTAAVSSSAEIGGGVFIGPRTVVNARARIGHGVIVNSGAIVEHDVEVGACAHIAPRTVLGGNASVGEHALAGIGSVVLPGVKIGDRAILGGGSVATMNVPPSVTAIGVPARVRDDKGPSEEASPPGR